MVAISSTKSARKMLMKLTPGRKRRPYPPPGPPSHIKKQILFLNIVSMAKVSYVGRGLPFLRFLLTFLHFEQMKTLFNDQYTYTYIFLLERKTQIFSVF